MTPEELADDRPVPQFVFAPPAASGYRPRWILSIVLFLLTLFTTALAGARMQRNFELNEPFFDIERDIDVVSEFFERPEILWSGLPFAFTLLVILTAHELGHYLACVHYRVRASLPYFLPAPTFAGTFGAFIRIRSPIYSKRTLFDIGIAGPLAGFVFLLPALGIGLAFSKVLPGIAQEGSLTFGAPLLLRAAEAAIFPGVPAADIYLHPVARAAWVGLIATALNLLPIGQLDGGHVLYAFAGDHHRLLSRVFVALLLPLGLIFWYGWLFWAAVLFFLGMRHPSIYDLTPIGPGRARLAILALVVFLLCFSVTPIETAGGF